MKNKITASNKINMQDIKDLAKNCSSYSCQNRLMCMKPTLCHKVSKQRTKKICEITVGATVA
jgi:hypothetical protein